MNIFCVDYQHAGLLSSLGHNVLAPNLKAGVASLPEELERHDFAPDLIIQREHLGRRVILSDLDTAPCPTVFIAIDTHLNMFWQQHYARLFDLALTPHLTLFKELADDDGHTGRLCANVRRLRHDGFSRPWRDYQTRSHDLTFCGVVDEHRPLRRAMLELLSTRFPLYRPEGRIPQPEMFELFADSRVIPNESIAKEVNFRLFEGASCGCLVLGQNIGEDQNVCFEPDKEVIIYEHGLELVDKCAFYLKNRREAQMIARRAWARVHAEHLPEHRVAELLQLSRGACGRARGGEVSRQYLFTLLQFARHGSVVTPAKWLYNRLLELPENVAEAEVAAALLALLAEAAQPESPLYDQKNVEFFNQRGLELYRALAVSGLHEGSTGCNLAASCFALYQGEKELSAVFTRRQAALEAAEFAMPTAESAYSGDFYDLYVFWSEVLQRRNKLARSGFQLRLLRGFMPGSALECLLLAQAEMNAGTARNPDDRDLMRRLHEVCGRLPGYGFMDMGFLAHMSLHDQQNWSLQLRYGLSALNCLNVSTGLLEIGEAWTRAMAAGQAAAFESMLAEAPSSGYIQRALTI